MLPDKTSRFVEECTYGKTEIKGPGTSDGGEFAALANKTHTYYVRYGALYQVEAPRFCFDYPDNWKVEREETSQETDWDDSPPGNFVAARIRQTGGWIWAWIQTSETLTEGLFLPCCRRND